MRKWPQKREAELQQLINDIAEDCNLDHWKPQDFIDCIIYQQDLLAQFFTDYNIQRAAALTALTSVIKELVPPVTARTAQSSNQSPHP